MLLGQYPFPLNIGIVPGSDGAGEVLAVGKKVTRFKNGAKVVTLFNQLHLGGLLSPAAVTSGLGGSLDGTLRQYAVFNENGLVDMPPSLSYLEAATLPCAAVTAVCTTLFLYQTQVSIFSRTRLMEKLDFLTPKKSSQSNYIDWFI